MIWIEWRRAKDESQDFSVFLTESVDVWKVRISPVKITTLVDPVWSSSVRILALLEPSERWEAKKVIKIKSLFKILTELLFFFLTNILTFQDGHTKRVLNCGICFCFWMLIFQLAVSELAGFIKNVQCLWLVSLK